MSNEVKKYNWKYIINTLVIPDSALARLHYGNAIEYFCNYYSGYNEGILFPKESVIYIHKEIKEEAEHKMHLSFLRETQDN